MCSENAANEGFLPANYPPVSSELIEQLSCYNQVSRPFLYRRSIIEWPDIYT